MSLVLFQQDPPTETITSVPEEYPHLHADPHEDLLLSE